MLQDQRLEALKWPLSEQLIVRCAQLLLALPAVDPSPVDGLMDFCAATQLPPGEGEINDVPAEVSAQNALLRGSLWAEIDVFFLACVMPLMLMGESRKDGTARQDLNIRCHWHVPTWCSTSNKTTKTLTITTANLPSGNEVSRYHVIRMCVHDLQCIFKILYANLQQPTRSYGTHLDMLNCSTVGEFNAQTTMESNTYADTGSQKTNVQVLYI